MAKILILIGQHICTAPRPQKEAETLTNAGHDVKVLGFWFKQNLVERDLKLTANKKWRFVPLRDYRGTNWQGRLKNLNVRLRGRLAREIFRLSGRFSPRLLGYDMKAMLQVARQESADLTIVHFEGGLWIGDQLIRDGYNVGVDFEDWFSEDLLPEVQGARPVANLKNLEKQLAQNSTYCLTTSHALANSIANAYQVPPPAVVYNAFPLAERQQLDHQWCDRQDMSLPSLHWYSQSIGPGRGLELLLEALGFLSVKMEIHLRGNCSVSTRQWLESLIPIAWRESVFIHPTVANAELLSRIVEHDIGLALELPYCENKQLTVSNKLLQYLQAGLCVIATDTTGQREVLQEYPDAGYLISPHDPVALANAIESVIHSTEKLRACKNAALRAAEEKYCWELQVPIILAAANSALNVKC